ncbi:MAG: dihydrofolate reductase family protein [Cyclobacteriaceae bacterium]
MIRRRSTKLNQREKDVWVVGGGLIITEFLYLGASDEMILCVIPTILGSGIQLFPNHPKETKFDLIKTEPFDTGAVMLTYKKK